MRRSRPLQALAILGLALGLGAAPAALAPIAPGNVTLGAAEAAPVVVEPGDVFVAAGSFNAAVGCPGDWNNDCAEAALTLDEDSGLLAAEFDLPAGSYEYKISRNASWTDEDVWGAWGEQPGSNIAFTTDGSLTHLFFDPSTGQSFAANPADLYTVPGSYQSTVGCPGDWQPECLATVMFPQADGTYRYQTTALPSGSYELKVTRGLSWGQNWGADGVAGGANIGFTTSTGELVVVDFDPATTTPTVTVENPPVAGTGQQRAIWLDVTTIAWPTSLSAADADYSFVGHPEIAITPGTLTAEQTDLDWRTRTGYRALALSDAETGDPLTRDDVVELLKGSIEIEAAVDDVAVARTGAQIASVLDVVYPGAADQPLGIVWDGATPTLRLWAPTATDVTLLLWTGAEVDANGNYLGDAEILPATRDDDGVWTVPGTAQWLDAQYLWSVDVFVPSVGDVVTNVVTDPNSLGLTIDSQRSVVVDLADPRWAPEGWSTSSVAPLRTEAEQTIYELHVRDFSAWDSTVPVELRGTYLAFTLEDSDGVNHLRALAEAGLTTVHLLPTFDIATTTIPENRADQVTPEVPDAAPDSSAQQAAVAAVANRDAFNWGYDPFHWSTPEGSYATDGNQVGGDRSLEYREMVSALHDLDLRVVQDVVFNHTSAAGQSASSVLDRVVPGYYHRLNATGGVENSTCCSNIATEHTMAQKIMVDSILTQATAYRIDGFRFDLMGHHSLENMLAVREALDSLTLADDGVDGTQIYLYGEGWDFGEVAGNARFIQATQANIAGTGIGAFNDRLRDAVRGGGPFDNDQRTYQGFGTGEYTSPNATAEAELTPEAQLASLRHNTDLIRVGLAGSLADFELLTSSGEVKAASDVDYNGQPAGFTSSPQESVNYVEAHDNETLFDNGVWKLPTDASLETRVRSQVLSNATVLLGQSPAFLASGTELLRSKSLDRDSYNSGDWFNAIDWTGTRSTFGTGLPIQEKNGDKWGLMAPLLADAALRPDASAMEETNAMVLDLLAIRSSTPLFTLGDADLIQDQLTFPNSGPDATPGLLVMAIDDGDGDLDPALDGVVVVFNATPDPITEAIDDMAGRELALHPVQAAGADDVVRTAEWDAETGTATVPGWTVAVFVAEQADEPEPTPTPSETTPTPTPSETTPTPTDGPSDGTTPTPTSSASGGPGGGLPDTGSDVGVFLLLAAGLVACGVALRVRRARAAA